MNNTKLVNTLAALSFTALILVVLVGFGWRNSSATADATTADNALAAPADVVEKQALESELVQMQAAIELMQTREQEYQAQIETANALLTSGAATSPDTAALQQQLTAQQQALAVMQAREQEYQAQIALANQRLAAQQQQTAAPVVVQQPAPAAQPAAPAPTYNDDDGDHESDHENDDDHGGEHENEHESEGEHDDD